MNNWNYFINSQSVKVRFLTTLFVNIARVGLGFLGGIVIARSLGPAGYGNYSFLLVSFVSIMALVDMGTSSAFYTFLSQRKRSSKFYLYYFWWIGIQFTLVLLLVAFIFPDAWREKIWLGHPKEIIILAFVASFMMSKLWNTVTQAGESIRATIVVQLHNIFIAGLYLCIILGLFFLHLLTIPNLFITITFVYLLLSVILAKKIKNNLVVKEEIELQDVFNEFKVYCIPLVLYGIVDFAYSFADVWLLQRFGGAAEQGFYSVGLRFGGICLIATTSMISVFWKEIAEANELENKERLYYLYTKMSRGLCFVGAVGACFLIPFSKEILVFLFGPKYERGWLCLAVMFLYPIYQSLGQINGVFLQATGQTKLKTKIGIISMMVSIPVTYFVLAPTSNLLPGLGLGSVGLAFKMVTLATLFVNVYIYFISKLSRWKFDFLFQFKTIGFLLIASFAVKRFLSGVSHISNVSVHPLFLLTLSIPLYILAVGLILYLFPELSGLERKQVTNSILLLNRFLKTKRY